MQLWECVVLCCVACLCLQLYEMFDVGEKKEVI